MKDKWGRIFSAHPPLYPSHQGRGYKRETSHRFPLPLWERARERGIFGAMTKE